MNMRCKVSKQWSATFPWVVEVYRDGNLYSRRTFPYESNAVDYASMIDARTRMMEGTR